MADLYHTMGARVAEYQQHPSGGPYSAASPWVLRSWDINGLMVEFNTSKEARAWLMRYLFPTLFDANPAYNY